MEIWQQELREGFQNMEALLSYLEIPHSHIQEKFDSQSEFPLKVPRSFAERMEKGNPHDPLFLQVIPQLQEKLSPQNYQHDAVGDLIALKSKGLIQKYHGRVLLVMTGACAVHCRYCFRRHFPYNENSLNPQDTHQLLSYLQDNPSIIEEIIFSGGDPLLLSNKKLEEWVQILHQLPNIKRWRIHTRLASVLPSRIDDGLLRVLASFQKEDRKTILVNHINHPNEIKREVPAALRQLTSIGITLLNQSVLLHRINDQLETLKLLSEKLFHNGVLPYYLHLLDRTQGTHHFDIPETKAKELYAQLLANLPGYLVPKLVREIQGEPNKTLVTN